MNFIDDVTGNQSKLTERETEQCEDPYMIHPLQEISCAPKKPTLKRNCSTQKLQSFQQTMRRIPKSHLYSHCSPQPEQHEQQSENHSPTPSNQQQDLLSSMFTSIPISPSSTSYSRITTSHYQSSCTTTSPITATTINTPLKRKKRNFRPYQPTLSQLSATTNQSTPTKSPKPGRPSILSQISDDLKSKIAITVVKYKVAYRNVAELACMWNPSGNLSISPAVISNVVLHVYGRVFAYICQKMLVSKYLTVTIDGSSDLHQRQPLAVQLQGIFHKGESNGSKHEESWAYPVKFVEPQDHTAETQLDVLKRLFQDISELGSVQGSKVIDLGDLHAIVFDTTSSNTGMKKGLAGFLPLKKY
jgi:hypothetical protein